MAVTIYDLARAADDALEGCAEAEQIKIDQINTAETRTGEGEA